MEKTAQQQFDELLKNSVFFLDTINSTRLAAGYAVGQILGRLLSGKSLEDALALREAIKAEFQEETDRGPSFDTSRRIVLEAVAQGMDSVMSPGPRLQQHRQRLAQRAATATGDTAD
jgi:hypothetical protein